jgi:hypothetical protein
MMKSSADLLLFNKRTQLILVAEVYSLLGKTADWAAQLRSNLLANDEDLPAGQFFLLALPDHFYLWKDCPSVPDPLQPTYEIDPTFLFESYYEGAPAGLIISRESIEIILMTWLTELARQKQLPAELRQSQPWLQDSGFFEAIREGQVILPERE